MIFCVTGNMAAGKNYVCSIFENAGWLCIDEDKVAHEAIKKASPIICKEFEKEAKKAGIFLQNPDGSLNRKNLGALLFPNPDLLNRQENIIYPIVIEETKKIISQNTDKNIILNAAVLYKTPELLQLCQKIIFITAPALIRIIRAKKRDNLPLRQIISRIISQKNLLEKYKKTGIELCIISNFGSNKKLKNTINKKILN